MLHSLAVGVLERGGQEGKNRLHFAPPLARSILSISYGSALASATD
jgi:hypothetical protein